MRDRSKKRKPRCNAAERKEFSSLEGNLAGGPKGRAARQQGWLSSQEYRFFLMTSDARHSQHAVAKIRMQPFYVYCH